MADADRIRAGRLVQLRPVRQRRSSQRGADPARVPGPEDRRLGADGEQGERDHRLQDQGVRAEPMDALGEAAQHLGMEARPAQGWSHTSRHPGQRSLRLARLAEKRARLPDPDGVLRLPNDAEALPQREAARRETRDREQGRRHQRWQRMKTQTGGMAVVENTIDIRSSPEDVFDYCTNLAREPEWNPKAKRVEKVSAGPIAWESVGRSPRLDAKSEGRVSVTEGGRARASSCGWS